MPEPTWEIRNTYQPTLLFTGVLIEERIVVCWQRLREPYPQARIFCNGIDVTALVEAAYRFSPKE